MQFLIDYFTTIPSLHRSLILAGGITFFWLIESSLPLFKFGYKKWNHAGINFFFTFTTILVNFSMAVLLVKTADFIAKNQFGILFLLSDLPLVIKAILGLMLLDLIGAYFIHWLEHRVKWMWGFHAVHHTDIHVDTTTANRHHPGESVFRFVFTILAVLIVGAPIWMIFLYQSMSAFISQFNHSNLVLPKNIDKFLSWLIVTPNMHHVHHHYKLPQTDQNFGNIFSIWDRIFNTFTKMNNADIVYGLDTHQAYGEHSNIITMLKIPFGKYRKPN